MKPPSIRHAVNSTYQTISRFPFETLSAIIGTTMALCLLENNDLEKLFIKILLCSSVGLVVFLSSSLFFEARHTKQNYRLSIQFVLLLLLGGYYFTFSESPTEFEIIRFVVLSICFHLAVSFAAYIGNNHSLQSFWEFNKQLFIRLITGGIYSGVLFAGLALAIVAVDKLFVIDFDEKIYPKLFFFICGIFNTLFFLAGVPPRESFEDEVKYPKGLKSFTQYVLIPLVSIYLIILLSYEVKIIATLSLPYGWASNLILVFAIFGILSFLLLYPISTHSDHPWIKIFNRWFYYLLVPLLVLLYWAIGYRINMYGFTEERYYVFILALWLTFITAYFLFVKNHNIKLIPISLCITGLLSVYGPQSARSVAQYSQLKRYDYYFEIYQTNKLSQDDEQELCRVIDYVYTNGGLNVLAQHSNHKLDSLQQTKPDATPTNIVTALGLKYTTRYGIHTNNHSYFYINNEHHQYPVSGYDAIVIVSESQQKNTKDSLLLNEANYRIQTTKEDNKLKISLNDETISFDVLSFVNKLKPTNDKQYTDTDLSETVETNQYQLKIQYTTLSANIQNEKYKLNSYAAVVYVKLK